MKYKRMIRNSRSTKGIAKSFLVGHEIWVTLQKKLLLLGVVFFTTEVVIVYIDDQLQDLPTNLQNISNLTE